MEEDNQKSVDIENEVATQEVTDDSTQAENEVQTPQVDEKAEEQERNWRAMRQRDKEKEIALKQKDDEIAAMRAVLAQVAQPQKPVQEEEQIDLEEYSTYGGVQKVARKTVQPLEEKIAHLEGLIKKQDEEKRIRDFRKQYPDFDDVVNVETLELLEKREPELANDIAQSTDPFMMGFRSYKTIKALGLQADVPTSRRVAEVDKKIEQNKKTVQSPQAYDKRPMAKAFKTTAADQKRLYEEMMGFASQA